MRLLMLLILVTLAGCAPRTIVRVERVEVPVAVCPAPPEVRRPTLPIQTLSPSAGAPDVLRAYVASVALLMGYAHQLEILLDAYRAGVAR